MKRELIPEFLEDADKLMARHDPPVRDAATLLLVDWQKDPPLLLAGKRKETLAFMPGLTVFPGGAVDAEDEETKNSGELSPETRRRLRLRAPTLSETGARALAIAAIRELHEETGLIYDAAALAGLRLIARAITPPYRPRRFDTRFFLGDKRHAVESAVPAVETDLEKIEWLTLAQILNRPLAFITRQVLTDISPLLQKHEESLLARPYPFYYVESEKYYCETIS